LGAFLGTELNLSDCEIRKLGSFKSIVRLKLLVRLNLSHNYLQGMPPTVKKLVNLEELDISYNEIHVLPWELYQLTNLRVLITEGNGITALPAPAISRLVKLEVRFLPPLSVGSTLISCVRVRVRVRWRVCGDAYACACADVECGG
jgi:hypothetical protein